MERLWILALALPVSLSSFQGCQAHSGQNSPTVTGALVTVPVQKPGDAYAELFSQLRDRAASEVADGKSKPVIFTLPWGIGGAKVMVGAVTPRRGTFYVVDAGPYRPGTSALALLRDKVEACRVQVNWADEPFNGDPRSMSWIQSVLPSPGCAPATPAWFARYKARKGWSAASVFKLLGKTASGGISVSLVAEKQIKREGAAADSYSDPFDPNGAIELVAGNNDKIISTTPLPNLDIWSAYAVMRSGRVFVNLVGREGGYNGCVVENLSWDDVAQNGRSPRLNAAIALCDNLRRSSEH